MFIELAPRSIPENEVSPHSKCENKKISEAPFLRPNTSYPRGRWSISRLLKLRQSLSIKVILLNFNGNLFHSDL